MQPNENGGPLNPQRRPRPIMDMLPAQPVRRSAGQAPPPVRAPSPYRAIRPETPRLSPNPEPKTTKPKPNKSAGNDIERPSAAFILGLILVLILLGAGGAAGYYFLKYKPAHKPAAAAVVAKPINDNNAHVQDDSLGIKFAITKDFTIIDKTQLAKENPSFIYGYEQKDVNNLRCIISQTKLQKPVNGSFSPDSLRDGIISEVKKTNPDVKTDSATAVTLDSGQNATALVYHYTDNKTVLKEKMVIANTKTVITFAFCSSPQPLFSYYDAKFEPFFNSLEVY
ncbi:MAG: hypothetical protein ACXWLH_02085 [Candidatus Saccharimonadales bacterium]